MAPCSRTLVAGPAGGDGGRPARRLLSGGAVGFLGSVPGTFLPSPSSSGSGHCLRYLDLGLSCLTRKLIATA